jgi:hypothetical protein
VFSHFEEVTDLRSMALVCTEWRDLCCSGPWPCVTSFAPNSYQPSLQQALGCQNTAYPNLLSLDLSSCGAVSEPWLQGLHAPQLLV